MSHARRLVHQWDSYRERTRARSKEKSTTMAIHASRTSPLFPLPPSIASSTSTASSQTDYDVVGPRHETHPLHRHIVPRSPHPKWPRRPPRPNRSILHNRNQHKLLLSPSQPSSPLARSPSFARINGKSLFIQFVKSGRQSCGSGCDG